jgi:hypothetical protein
MTTESELETPRVYTAFASREPELDETMKRLARIAKRIGVQAPTLTIVKRYTRDFKPLVGKPYPVGAIDYILEGDRPKLEGGWNILARIVHLGDAGNVITVNPTLDIAVSQFENLKPNCEHCNQKRARAKTVIVENADGDRKQIGKTCLKDYVGHDLPALWDIWEALETAELGDDFSGPRSYDHTPAFYVIAYATRAIELDGWKPASDPRSTANLVRQTLTLNRATNPWVENYVPNETNVADAQAAYDWITQTEPTDSFTNNLKTVVIADATEKYFNMIACLPHAWKRHNEVAVAKAVEVAEPTAPCLTGKVEITGTVLKAYVKDTNYGSRAVMVVQDERGFKVWGSNTIYAKAGDTVRFTATVEAGDDPTFGFFTRPSKAEVLVEATA